jgi:hypothetical protein
VARGLAELLQGIEAGAKLRRVVDRAWSRWTGNANISIAFSHRHAPNKLHASTPGICERSGRIFAPWRIFARLSGQIA